MKVDTSNHYLVECEVRIWDLHSEPGCGQLVFSVCQSTTDKSTIEAGDVRDIPAELYTLLIQSMLVTRELADKLRDNHRLFEIAHGGSKKLHSAEPAHAER